MKLIFKLLLIIATFAGNIYFIVHNILENNAGMTFIWTGALVVFSTLMIAEAKDEYKRRSKQKGTWIPTTKR